MSSSLFNLVMDPLLADLKSKNLGLGIQGLFLGAFAHAELIPMTQLNKFKLLPILLIEMA